MSWFSSRDELIENEMLIVVLSDGLCRVAEMIDIPMDCVDQVFDDTSRRTKTVLKTINMYRDDRKIWDV